METIRCQQVYFGIRYAQYMISCIIGNDQPLNVRFTYELCHFVHFVPLFHSNDLILQVSDTLKRGICTFKGTISVSQKYG